MIFPGTSKKRTLRCVKSEPWLWRREGAAPEWTPSEHTWLFNKATMWGPVMWTLVYPIIAIGIINHSYWSYVATNWTLSKTGGPRGPWKMWNHQMKNPINPIKQPTGWLFIDMASALNGNLMEIYWGYRLTAWWFGTMKFYLCFHFIYGIINPSHWRTPSFSEGLVETTNQPKMNNGMDIPLYTSDSDFTTIHRTGLLLLLVDITTSWSYKPTCTWDTIL